ncbi:MULTISPECIES: 16S rRNA (guanine(527)-N(7))-methyltransferase RsmG [Methylotenera]|uniref:16S rRNA (guanine(527)-N(7))-methyltransferase RsmG n=1 Tax=Methylotenera TaxID=359407 RepID=UPI00037FAF6E|nr:MULTISPECIES: 16S rRNA (guanine(527)-N(7))-methyltransferase RsmG [Methylotenera]
MSQAILLAQGIASMGLAVAAETQEKLLAYLSLLNKWNKVYNLTAVRDPLEMVTLHLLDSLSVLPHINSKNLLDVGSGGGLPGIVLAICKPELQVTTIDTVQKKAIFMRQVKGELGLDNLTAMHARVENFQPSEPFEIVISRAFSEIALFIQLTKHLIATNGQWLAMKGMMPSGELDGLPILPSNIIPLKVAGLDAERHLVVFKNTVI